MDFGPFSRLLSLASQPNPKFGRFWNMVQNKFFLNPRVTEELCSWKSNKQLLLLQQVESEICNRDYEIKATCLSSFYLKKYRRKKMQLFQVTKPNGKVWAHPDLLTHRLILMLALPRPWNPPRMVWMISSVIHVGLFTNAMFLQILTPIRSSVIVANNM